MIKKELVALVAEKTGLSKEKVDEVLMFTTGFIRSEVCSGGNVTLKNFGVFKKKTVKATVKRDFHRGVSIYVPEHDKVVFKASDKF